MIGGIVCIAAANAGNTSQDLKTGFLVGATPSAQQKGLFAGRARLRRSSSASRCIADEQGAREVTCRADIAIDIAAPARRRRGRRTTTFQHEGQTYTLLNVLGSTTIPEGKYLLEPADRAASRSQWIQGIGSAGGRRRRRPG